MGIEPQPLFKHLAVRPPDDVVGRQQGLDELGQQIHTGLRVVTDSVPFNQRELGVMERS